jgi:hypothetical protein
MSGGSSFRHERISSDDILRKIRDSETDTDKQEFDSWLNSLLDNLLGKVNNRDTEAIQRHIDSILAAINDEIEGTVSTRFGGSISKHTHIDGISDVDALVVLNNSELADKSPKEVLDYFSKRLRYRFRETDIEKGDTAVTVKFSDVDVQLVPAIRSKTGVKIPDGGEWSTVVKPSLFAKELTKLNTKMSGKLIPAIKLAKGIISGFSENCQMKGYHVESLALQIFGEKKVTDLASSKVKEIVIGFFRDAPKLVRKQIKDITGQTLYVDEYLGKKESIRRLMVADTLERTYRQMELAETGRMKNTWTDLLSHI